MFEKLQVLAGLWINLVDTAAKGEQGFSGGIEITVTLIEGKISYRFPERAFKKICYDKCVRQAVL
jgi:hypothetical protein